MITWGDAAFGGAAAAKSVHVKSASTCEHMMLSHV